MMAHPTLGQRVRELRAAKHLTYRALADAVGVHYSTLSRIEHDQGPVPLSTPKLAALAHVLGTDPDELIALAGKLPPEIAAALRVPSNLAKARHCLGLDQREGT